jgi:hypothetical protein
MKKYEFPNKNIKIEYVETYEKEVTEKRIKEYEKKKSKIPTTEGKLNFAETELVEYLKNVSPEVIYVSGQTNIQGPLFWDRYLKVDIDNIKHQLNKEKNIGRRKKNSAKEFALAYILEMNSTGKIIPKSSQGEYAKNELEFIGDSEYNITGNTFYKAVKSICMDYDLNKIIDLENISPRWNDAIKEICTKRNCWDNVEIYLKQKGILKG